LSFLYDHSIYNIMLIAKHLQKANLHFCKSEESDYGFIRYGN